VQNTFKRLTNAFLTEIASKEGRWNGFGPLPPDTIRFGLRQTGGRRFWFWEQVDVRGFIRRALRLGLIAGSGIALLMPALAAPVAVATSTTLTAGTLSGCSLPLTIAVTAGGQPVTSGTVAIDDEFGGNSVPLASVALSAQGTATSTVNLAEGSHSLTAVFSGVTGYQTSTSTPAVAVSVATQCEFTVAVSPAASGITLAGNVMTLTPGDAGSATVTIAPSVEFTSALTAPMFITLSCSGLSVDASCNFTPSNVQILSTTTTPPTSTIVIQTLAASTTSVKPATRPGARSTSIAWAILLPGAFGLGGLAWGARRRRWLSRLALMALICMVTMLGTTGCNPLYNYEHHGPVPNPPTPAGSYTVVVYAQYSNGVTALTQQTSFALTVN